MHLHLSHGVRTPGVDKNNKVLQLLDGWWVPWQVHLKGTVLYTIPRKGTLTCVCLYILYMYIFIFLFSYDIYIYIFISFRMHIYIYIYKHRCIVTTGWFTVDSCGCFNVWFVVALWLPFAMIHQQFPWPLDVHSFICPTLHRNEQLTTPAFGGHRTTPHEVIYLGEMHSCKPSICRTTVV